MVADALEVVRDLEGAGDEPQVAGKRLLERQQSQAALVDVDLHPVDDRVVREHLARQRGVAALQGADRLLDDALDPTPHEQNLLLQGFELELEVTFHAILVLLRLRASPHPKRPVM